jgi:bifunctional enzyme CysN/CysC
MTDPIYKTDALIAEDIDAYLETHQHKSLLRFITCGSVDDGKSTLIGRLLYDSKMIFEDQLAALEADSKRVGTRTGHHHRRCLPFFRDRKAQVHRR